MENWLTRLFPGRSKNVLLNSIEGLKAKRHSRVLEAHKKSTQERERQTHVAAQEKVRALQSEKQKALQHKQWFIDQVTRSLHEFTDNNLEGKIQEALQGEAEVVSIKLLSTTHSAVKELFLPAPSFPLPSRQFRHFMGSDRSDTDEQWRKRFEDRERAINTWYEQKIAQLLSEVQVFRDFASFAKAAKFRLCVVYSYEYKEPFYATADVVDQYFPGTDTAVIGLQLQSGV